MASIRAHGAMRPDEVFGERPLHAHRDDNAGIMRVQERRRHSALGLHRLLLPTALALIRSLAGILYAKLWQEIRLNHETRNVPFDVLPIPSPHHIAPAPAAHTHARARRHTCASKVKIQMRLKIAPITDSAFETGNISKRQMTYIVGCVLGMHTHTGAAKRGIVTKEKRHDRIPNAATTARRNTREHVAGGFSTAEQRITNRLE